MCDLSGNSADEFVDRPATARIAFGHYSEREDLLVHPQMLISTWKLMANSLICSRLEIASAAKASSLALFPNLSVMALRCARSSRSGSRSLNS